MINKQQEEILFSLQAQTDENILKWETTSQSNKLQLKLDGYSITIMHLDNEGFLTFSLEPVKAQINFIDSRGKVFDSITAYETSDMEYGLIGNLYYSARRVALRINEKYSDILSQLNKTKK